MKKVLFILAIAMCMGAITALGMDRVKKTVPLPQFNKVMIKAGITVNYAQGSKYECIIIASPKDMENVKVEVKDQQLNISVESEKKKINGVTFSSAKLFDEVVVKVTSPELKVAESLGSGDFIATTDIKTNDIRFKVTGSGDIKLRKVTADWLILTISGSGDIDLQQANAEKINASVAGSGDIDIDNVASVCKKAELSVAGSGNIDATFSDCHELKCSVAGSGEIELKGKVVNYSSSIAGSGEIKKNELVITGNSSESNTNGRSILRKRPRTVNNINARP